MTTLLCTFAAIGAVLLLALFGLLICSMFDGVNPTQRTLDDVEKLLKAANKPPKRRDF
jgi:hypothetical protein